MKPPPALPPRLSKVCRDVTGEAVLARAPRATVGEALREGLGFRERASAFERVGSERRGSRHRLAAQREGGDGQGEQERQEGRTVQAPVQHAGQP